MTFYCVYTKNRKKVDKYFKNNRIRNKFVIDIPTMLEEEDLSFEEDASYIKLFIFNLVNQAVERDKDVYYIPYFNEEFSVSKLLNLRKLLGENQFNVLIFHDEFRKEPDILEELYDNLPKFSGTQILRDY